VFRSPLTPIFLVVAVDVFGLTLMIPLLPYYAQHFGASPLVVGLLLASFAACQLLSAPIVGRISDTAGRKRTLIASQLGSCIGFLVLGFANTLWLVFLGRIIDGLTAGNLTIAQAYISDVTKPEERTRAFGLIGIAFGMGFLLGPAISGYLSKFGYHYPAFAAAGLSLLSVVASTFLLRDVKPTRSPVLESVGRIERITQYFRRSLPRRRLLEFFAFILSFSMLIGGTSLFLARRMGFSAEQTGYVFGFSGLIGAAVQGGVLGRLAKRFGEERLAIVGFATMGVGLALLGTVYNIPYLLVLVALGAFGSSVVRPSLTTLLTHSVGAHEQGAILGVSQSLSSIAAIAGPIIAGWLIENDWLGAYGAVAGAVALVGAVLVMRERGVTVAGDGSNGS
jgi:MFS transporter, DHA1 family, tetracycline resistance protein